MGSLLHIVGLGPAGLDQITLGNYKRLKAAEKVFVRTLKHPCVEDLQHEGIQVESFDILYDNSSSFEEVYEGIVKRLEEELANKTEVVYAVPGHPTVAEKSVKLILNKLARDFEVVIHPALSFLDNIFTAVSLDPIDGLLVRNHDALKGVGITGREWLIIPQIHNKFIASDVKLDLMDIYPDEAPVMIVTALGTAEQQVITVPLYELDHHDFDHLTSLVIPPHDEVISMSKLEEVMRILRSPQGCPWDREQTHDTLKPYLLEECYEVLEAIENKDMNNLAEELGDLLLQVIFHAQVASEAGEFAFHDVLRGIIHKLVRRHPHVFGGLEVENSDEVIKNWEQIKKKEKRQDERRRDQRDEFFKAPKGLPALMLANYTQKAAATVGFDWPDWKGPLAKVYEELRELEAAMAKGEGVREEFGDILFAMVNLSRFLSLDPEEVLRETVFKFQNRFKKMAELAALSGFDLHDLSLEQMDKYWDEAKIQEKSAKITKFIPH